MSFTTINPATEEPLHAYRFMSGPQVMAAADQARQAFGAWSATTVAERVRRLRRLAQVLRQNRDHYARIMTLEMGKPIAQGRSEVEKCAWCAEVYAELGPAWLKPEPVQADGLSHEVCFEPLGVILSIMPWNFPFWQVFRCAVPVLLAGNTTLLKHANNVSACALTLEKIFAEAGFGPGVFQTLIADHDTVADLMRSEAVAGVSLTGSTRAGRHIGALAGQGIKKCVLELGGSDPFIVLDDADLDFTVPHAVLGRMQNAGQSCIAAKRFIVPRGLAGKFIEAFAAGVRKMIVGDPLDEKTDMGPLVNAAAREGIEAQVNDAVARGATVVTGARRLPRRGYFYEPTILTDVTPTMRCFREEVFGPVAVVLTAADDDEAVALANDSDFGLGGSVWTKDLDRGRALAQRLHVGAAFVNSIVKSDPRVPFGGIKQSGLGRELAQYGLREFTNIKSLSVYPGETM